MGKCNEKPRYYFGIDLGTTNSVLAWAQVNPDEPINPEVVQITMVGGPGANPVGRELLPSCVYFDANDEAIVGPYAKDMLIFDHQRVNKSIKTRMGTGGAIAPSDLSPPRIAAKILNALVDGCPHYLPKEELLKEAVICVPASFTCEKRKATMEAAIAAGFQNPILFEEPVAALYDYSDLQNRGKRMTRIPSGTVLVFDLGGGTLDVSLHTVCYTQNQNLAFINEIETETIAVSRYFDIGGDNFDELLADRFLDVYEKKHGCLPNRADLKPKFQEYAEQAKMFLSREIENAKIHGPFNPNTISIDFQSRDMYGIPDMIFNYELALTEYEKIVSPLLAYGVTLGATTQRSNIIYPILEVLEKGKEKLGYIPELKAVLLNGAMTKLHTIQKRLEDLFNPVPILYIGDPDRAVARGAVVHHYHYNLHHP